MWRINLNFGAILLALIYPTSYTARTFSKAPPIREIKVAGLC